MKPTWMLILASIVLAIGCVQRPPEIKSPPNGAAPPPPSECTVTNGTDERGHPTCSDGCKWDPDQRQCARVSDI